MPWACATPRSFLTPEHFLHRLVMKERGALVSTEARLACPVGIPEMACRAEARQNEGWSAWQELHLQPSRFERDASASWATRGCLAELKLRAKAGAHGRICTGTVRVLSAPSLRWTTWAKIGAA